MLSLAPGPLKYPFLTTGKARIDLDPSLQTESHATAPIPQASLSALEAIPYEFMSTQPSHGAGESCVRPICYLLSVDSRVLFTSSGSSISPLAKGLRTPPLACKAPSGLSAQGKSLA